jgi:hypothetical protein
MNERNEPFELYEDNSLFDFIPFLFVLEQMPLFSFSYASSVSASSCI